MDLGDDISIRPLTIGEPAYPLYEWLMKPYPLTDISARQRKFNRNLSRARVVVEQAFGKLKGRWRSVYKLMEGQVKKNVCVIEICCILHNICQDLGDQTDPSEYEIEVCGEEGNRALVSLDGDITRENITNYLTA